MASIATTTSATAATGPLTSSLVTLWSTYVSLVSNYAQSTWNLLNAVQDSSIMKSTLTYTSSVQQQLQHHLEPTLRPYYPYFTQAYTWIVSLILSLSTSLTQFASSSPFLFTLLVSTLLLTIIYFIYAYINRPPPAYLIDFATFKPPSRLHVTQKDWIEKSSKMSWWPQEDLDFQLRLLERSGLGNETSFPESIMRDTPLLNIRTAREEAEMVMFGALDELFAKTKINPKDIDILVVNCSLFNPTPSLTAMIINKYKLKNNILSFNLAGMGCSAGIISIGLARDLLQVRLFIYL